MATSYVHPSEIWAGTFMSFTCGGTNLPHQTSSAFIRGCAFEHIVIPTHPLPSY